MELGTAFGRDALRRVLAAKAKVKLGPTGSLAQRPVGTRFAASWRPRPRWNLALPDLGTASGRDALRRVLAAQAKVELGPTGSWHGVR